MVPSQKRPSRLPAKGLKRANTRPKSRTNKFKGFQASCPGPNMANTHEPEGLNPDKALRRLCQERLACVGKPITTESRSECAAVQSHGCAEKDSRKLSELPGRPEPARSLPGSEDQRTSHAPDHEPIRKRTPKSGLKSLAVCRVPKYGRGRMAATGGIADPAAAATTIRPRAACFPSPSTQILAPQRSVLRIDFVSGQILR